MRRRLLTIVMTLACLAWVAAASSSVEAGEWMFRRSYYSHAGAPGLLDESSPSRAAAREPWVGAHPRFAIRGGWRFNSYVLQNGPNSVDRTFFRENWYDVNY